MDNHQEALEIARNAERVIRASIENGNLVTENGWWENQSVVHN